MTDQDSIKSAMEGIEPESGARERMLENIKRKAEARSAPKKRPSMTKWAIPTAACLTAAAAAVIGWRMLPPITETSDPSSDLVLVDNPIQPADSAEEFGKRLGITLDAPEKASDIQYTIIDNEIADVSFIYGSTAYNARASKQSGDFSGISGDEISAEQIDGENGAVLTVISSDETYLKLAWTDGEVYYILSCEGGDTDGIKEVYSLMRQ